MYVFVYFSARSIFNDADIEGDEDIDDGDLEGMINAQYHASSTMNH